MPRQSRLLYGFAVSFAAVAALAATSSWQKEDPSQWTSEDIYQILNNSPWSKSVTVVVSRAGSYEGSERGNGGTWGEGIPGAGGMGRGGWGGMGGGMGRGRGGYPRTEQGPTVTVRWASALPVRLAEAKSSGEPTGADAMKPDSQYVIAVVGFPKSGFEPHSSSASDTGVDDEQLADHLKVITVLTIGHERLNPTKVELNQGRDGRALFYFDKEEPVTAHDKDAEFRITGDRMEIRKKFPLKDMEYQGKLEL